MNKNDIVWEDEDSGFDEIDQNSKKSGSEFEALLSGESTEKEYYQKGSQVSGKIIKIPQGSGDVVVELDSSNHALMSTAEFQEHYKSFSVGDTISAFFTSYTDGAIILEHSLSSSANSKTALEDAYNNRSAVKGKVESTNKGGFELTVMGKKAFCPISQISNAFVENPEDFVGKTFEFMITKYSGRDIVVSRRELLKVKEKETLILLKQSVASNPIVEGTISEIKDFGVIVDINGLRGFCHISEMAHNRLNHPGEKVSVGQNVKFKVIEMETEGDKPKLSLSIKQAEKDPWEDISNIIDEGDSVTGTVTRLADFGAFVEVSDGLEGLIHISEMSWTKRIHHPKDVLSPGDKVNVRILSINTHDQRISLTMKSIEADPWNDIKNKYLPNNEYPGTVVSLKSFGAFVELDEGVTGFIPLKLLQKVYGPKYRKEASPPKKIKVTISAINEEERKILLGLGGEQTEDQNFEFEQYESKPQNPKTADSENSLGGFGELLSSAMKSKSK